MAYGNSRGSLFEAVLDRVSRVIAEAAQVEATSDELAEMHEMLTSTGRYRRTRVHIRPHH